MGEHVRNNAANQGHLFDLSGTWAAIDLSTANPEAQRLNINDPQSMRSLVDQEIRKHGANFGYGGYLERRGWYARNESFTTPGKARIIHLGIDFWVSANTPVHAPIDSIVESFKDNSAIGDYGPTIILKSRSNNDDLYCLYGHLSRTSLEKLYVGMPIKAGQMVGTIGEESVNGQWPPHLHFQLIKNLDNMIGDYPGVSSEVDLPRMKENCPDPLAVFPMSMLFGCALQPQRPIV